MNLNALDFSGFGSAFLEAAIQGDIPSLKRLAAEALTRLGEGPGKIACATLRTPHGLNALHWAVCGGKTAVCRFLVEDLNFDINSANDQGETPLINAIIRMQQPTAIYLIQNGADVTRSDNKGATSLHCAAAKGLKEIVSLLIAKGADIHAISEMGTPLHAAAFGGNDDILKFLLDLAVDPNSISPMDTTPLMLSVIGVSVECTKLLLKAGADPNEDCSRSQLTPLCLAVIKQRDDKMIRCLLNAGADPNKTDHSGMTALERAVLYGRHEVVQLLFPVTSWIPCYPDWTINGIMQHLQSKEATELRKSKIKEVILLEKARGKEAFARKNYLVAMFWYTQVLGYDPADAKALSNRSLCYTLMNDGKLALADAKACIRLEPGWAKAHYREGAAWKVLKNSIKAVESFSRALALEPGNKEIESANSEVLAERLASLGRGH